LYPSSLRDWETSAPKKFRVVPLSTRTVTWPLGRGFRDGLGDVLALGVAPGDRGLVIEDDPGVTPRLVFWGKSFVSPRKPKATRATKMSARNVEVAMLR
jgi:hypothetical protein